MNLSLNFYILKKIISNKPNCSDWSSETSSKSEYQMEGRLLLDVVVRESSAVFKLLSGEDETLLIWGDTFLILDLSLDVLNGVCWLDFKGDGFTGEGFDEDLHVWLIIK